ncbi:T9SS type A sorting domain-containing protein [Flavobacteriales bacterium]|nr:T9SS type A sorting domain-containing protein [Flavobacteriales bacterium]MDB4088734.1 T9SS type A sorting domain-containing protein [Flavobacteriales bacterium]
MNKTLLVFLFLFLGSYTFSQTKTTYTITKKGEVNVKESLANDLKVKLSNLEPPSPDGNSTKSYLLRRKNAIQEKYPQSSSRSGSRSVTIDDTLTVGKSFISNISSAGQPNDNSMAISNDGIVVSAFNSAVFIRDTEIDSTLGEISLSTFSAQIGMNYDNFDPKMIYDPEADRFILIYLAGRTVANSNIVICFSQTKDPMGVWNVYSVSGNPLNDGSWSDYPAISLTKDEAFITINLLNPGGTWQTSFKQTVIWQIDKADGYSGASAITTDLWSELKEGGGYMRNMHPVRGGFDLKSKTQYFLSNRNFAAMSDSIYLIKIDNTIASGTAAVDVKLINADINYFLAPNARQKGNRWFYTNDSRVLGGIVENGKIQFVQHCLDRPSGNCVIYHGVISDIDGTPSIKARTIKTTGVDYGYPNIVYGGVIPNENKSVIGFNHTGIAKFAGISAVYFDGNNYSKVKTVQSGASEVNPSVSYIMRWGDYFGMQRRYNESCNVWMSGYYGENKKNRSWVAEAILPGDCYDTVTQTPYTENTLFPNPSIAQTEIHFTLDEAKNIRIDLITSDGKLIRVLYDDAAKKGENRLSFSTESLASGFYYVRIYSGKENILTKKLMRR